MAFAPEIRPGDLAMTRAEYYRRLGDRNDLTWGRGRRLTIASGDDALAELPILELEQ